MIDGLRNLLQVAVIGLAHLIAARQVAAIALGGNKPEEFHLLWKILRYNESRSHGGAGMV
jgi:hypothetical protein